MSTKAKERKQAKLNKAREKHMSRPDIKYRGPLSYRALRIIGWIAMACAQAIIFSSLSYRLVGFSQFNDTQLMIMRFVSQLATPLFIIASFSLVLSGQRKIYHFLLIYGLGYLGIGSAICLFYGRYINSLFVRLGLSETIVNSYVTEFLKDHVEINVFADLFMFTLFHFFINFTPTKVFVGKKRIIFRLFALLPVAFIITSYILRIQHGTGAISLPFYMHPFMATKSPLVFLIFVLISLWIKYRERLFIAFGSTRKEYHEYLKTNRNSLAFSVTLVIIIGSVTLLEVFFLIGLFAYYAGYMGAEYSYFSEIMSIYQLGQCSGMLIAIPFILLYSYTRTHKQSNLDVIIPLAGIGLIVLVYIESIYQFITMFIK